MPSYRILAINPGSTSTKVGLFEDDRPLLVGNVQHSVEELKRFGDIDEQLEYRKDAIVAMLRQNGHDLSAVDAFSGRGGGLCPMEGGVYAVNDIMLRHGRTTTLKHPAVLGPLLAYLFSREYGGAAYVVNPPDVDEMDDRARITGLKGIYRESQFHALNQKETAIRAAAEMGKRYTDVNFVVAHLGGGISISAHRRGRVVDTTSNIIGNGPMTPTRAGELPSLRFMDLCFSGKYTRDQLYERTTKNGGLTDLLGTSDVREVHRMIEAGDAYARLVFDAFVYQIAKCIDSMATALSGDVDAILVTGGIARDGELIARLREMTGFLAPLRVYPGELELEALASGALRVLRGEEAAKTYAGVPIFKGFD